MSLLGLLVFFVAFSVSGQTPAPPRHPTDTPGLIKLTGEDERRAKELDEQIDKAMKADRWGEAITKGEELLSRPSLSMSTERRRAGWPR